jgi:uncharacterized membrane protein (UPF0182 family)
MAQSGDFQMPQMSDKDKRRVTRWGLIVLILIAVGIVLMTTLSPYVDYLWYLHDARHPQVFTLAYETRGLLFLPAFFACWGLLHFSLKRAFKLSLIYIDSPSTSGQVMISNALHFVQDRGWSLVRNVSPIFAFFSASGFSNEWNTYLAAGHGQSFGQRDPLFGLDLGFFVFTLPWYRALVNYAFGVFLLATLLTVAIYAGLQLLAAMAKVELGRPNIRLHIGLLTGFTLAILGVQLYLKTYEFGVAMGTQFTGAGYTASIQLSLEQIIAGLVILFGVTAMVLSRTRFVYDVLLKGGIGLLITWVVAIAIVPAVIQRFSVEPNKIGAESPFAARAIKMTRYAYGLDKISARDFPVQPVPTPQDLQASKATLDNMRLWDPGIVRQTLELFQGLKSFYNFSDVDVDRYTIDGKPTEVMLSPRDININGLPTTSRSWVYEKLQYTHGFGVVMSSVNTATADGQPLFLMRDIPPVAPTDIPLKEPRIYFSDYREETGALVDDYALVNSKQVEFDYPAQDREETNTWQGKGGIPVGGFFRRLALSVALGDGNLLISGNVTGETRLLMHRSVIDRCQRIYKFLRFDNDPYIVVIDGKVYWILDGFTATDQVPYSDTSGDGDTRLNYIRNSVKVIVDAYSGDTTAYAIDPNEPILKTYRSIYPGLVHDGSELPPAFRAHLRYPEDLFRLQSAELAQYHVTDPAAFLNNNDAWDLPAERGLSGSRTLLAPYYVEMTLPGESKDGFVLMLPFTPRLKANMSGWLAAHCDPDRYGELVLYNFARGANVAGAEQMETIFASDPKVNSARLQLQGGGNNGTEVVIGNMLVIPIGSSVMYAECLFPKSGSSGLQAAPRLKKVVLGLNGRLEVGDTYSEALDKLFGPTTAPAPSVGQTPPSTTQPAPKLDNLAKVKDALGLLDQADAALRSGDFAKYGELQKKAKAELRELAVGKG